VNDRGILTHINELVAEEHELLNKNGLSAGERDRLDTLQVQLDQCWDLLRQRRGKRHAGDDPVGAQVRDAAMVEKYRQ
jgi:Protein of unknown function (DUF2630)